MPIFRVLKGHDAYAIYATVIEAKDVAEAVRIASGRDFDGWHETGEVRQFDDNEIFDEEIEEIKSLPTFHVDGTKMTIYGTYGELTVDAYTGLVLGYEPSSDGADYDDIFRFDIKEWRETYPDEMPNGSSHDILDFAFWSVNRHDDRLVVVYEEAIRDHVDEAMAWAERSS